MKRSGFILILAAAILAGPVLTPAAAKTTAAKAKPAAKAVVPFIDDDLDRALAEAKQRDLPLFIESWAPW